MLRKVEETSDSVTCVPIRARWTGGKRRRPSRWFGVLHVQPRSHFSVVFQTGSAKGMLFVLGEWVSCTSQSGIAPTTLASCHVLLAIELHEASGEGKRPHHGVVRTYSQATVVSLCWSVFCIFGGARHSGLRGEMESSLPWAVVWNS